MHFKTRILAMTIAGLLPLTAMAIGGPSGPKIDYHTQGHLGEVMMNPYGIAPLTAIIRDGGYTLEDVKGRISVALCRRPTVRISPTRFRPLRFLRTAAFRFSAFIPTT